MFLFLGGCEARPEPPSAAGGPTATAVPATATSSPTAVPPTVTAVPTLTATPTPTPVPVVPLHFDHQQEVLPAEGIEAQLSPWLFEPDVANALPLAALADVSVEGTMVLTPEQAREDVAYLFALLKNGYAGYGYFNENGRFDRVQAQLNAAIGDQARVSREWLLEQILTRLNFLQDCHFSIGYHTLCQPQYFWTVADWYFYEEDGRYVTWQAGEMWWLTAVDGESPEQMLKLTLDAQGAPAFLLGQLANAQPQNSVLTFSLPEDNALEQMVGWETAVFDPPVVTYETYRTDSDIPVVVSRLFPAEDEKLPRFVADASDLAAEPIVIVDIRGNSGGSDLWAEQWVESFSGAAPAAHEIMSVLWTETAVQGKINAVTYLGYSGEIVDFLQADLAFVQNAAPEPWVTHYLPPIPPIANDNQLVVVLLDKGTASSAESFIGYLRQLENVVFVGENSGGVGQFGEVAHFVLPNTGLPVFFGTKLFFPPDLSFTEGIGFLPDVWVPAHQALELSLVAIDAGYLQPAP
ncbi:MAG: hypothetical protein IPM53_10875 [Anaerolineaceae bacterium]|nr:hypothetical protein [Anaerolineaceae bacterium]